MITLEKTHLNNELHPNSYINNLPKRFSSVSHRTESFSTICIEVYTFLIYSRRDLVKL